MRLAPRQPRVLIVNADDFGMSNGVNAGVIEAFERGIVTSSSLMVRGRAAASAAAYARDHPELSVGLHVDLGEWEYREESWRPVYFVVSPEDATAVQRELQHQIDRFRDLVGSDPTHLDSHQHVHRSDPVRSLFLDAGAALGVPVRGAVPEIRYEGGFYGQSGKGEAFPAGITVDGLIRTLAAIPTGITELGCHPGYVDPVVHTSYAREREIEVKTLSHPLVRRAIEDGAILLRSFRDFRNDRWSTYS